MIKTEDVDSTSGYFGRQQQQLHNGPLALQSLQLSAAPALPIHYPIIAASAPADGSAHASPIPQQQTLQEHHPQQQQHPQRHLELEEKPNMPYLNRHVLQSHPPQPHHDLMAPTSCASPAGPNKSPAPPIITSARLQSMFAAPGPQIHDFGTSTIKYCSSNGLEILPVHSQPAYVIQQCHSSAGPHQDEVHRGPGLMEQPQPQEVPVMGEGNGGGHLEVNYSANSVAALRKKESASPASSSCSAGSGSPTERQLPPDTTKKSSNTRRPEKPNMSYINMIAMAIKESPERMLTLNGIYTYLQQK